MAATQVTIGYNSSYEISTDGGSTWVEVEEIGSITPPSFTTDTVDATHMQSPNRTREFISGLIDPGSASFTINWIPGSASDVLLKGLQTNGTSFGARETYPNGVTSTYTGIVEGLTAAVPLDDKMSMEVTIKVASAVLSGASIAPTNVLLPAISGTAKDGQVLTAIAGSWTGVPTLTYQWKKGGSNISGATAATYTVVVGDVGSPISVVVTGTNSAGTASATSGATATVVS